MYIHVSPLSTCDGSTLKSFPPKLSNYKQYFKLVFKNIFPVYAETESTWRVLEIYIIFSKECQVILSDMFRKQSPKLLFESKPFM